ncbi:MAG TPA: hypothetical protein VFW40_05165 [Capsulimonadaceae bacterium]|nr:hypothetical protein [Capsulimonadaceae bacterium]
MLIESPQKLWDAAIPQAQKQIDDPIAWLAMQSARALVVEQDTLVLAVPAEVEYLAACLTDSANQPIFVDVLTSLAQKPIQLRVILGETLEDWDKIREKEIPPAPMPSIHAPPPMAAREVSFPPVDENAAVRPNRENLTAMDERVEERKSGAWDSTLEKISRGMSQTPLRQFPQGRAHYFMNSIRLISETMDRVIEESGGMRTELFERGVSRAIDRLAQAVEFDPLLVAVELERYREAHRKGIGDYSESLRQTTE